MEKELELLSGVIEEKQLKELVNNDVNGGTWSPVTPAKPTTPVSMLATAVTALTLNAGACPSSACTKSC